MSKRHSNSEKSSFSKGYNDYEKNTYGKNRPSKDGLFGTGILQSDKSRKKQASYDKGLEKGQKDNQISIFGIKL